MKVLSMRQVEYQVQLQQQSTCQHALPSDLPLELVPKCPVGFLPLLSPLPNCLAAVLDDDGHMAIAQISKV